MMELTKQEAAFIDKFRGTVLEARRDDQGDVTIRFGPHQAWLYTKGEDRFHFLTDKWQTVNLALA
jgi:hypothetical protein